MRFPAPELLLMAICLLADRCAALSLHKLKPPLARAELSTDDGPRARVESQDDGRFQGQKFASVLMNSPLHFNRRGGSGGVNSFDLRLLRDLLALRGLASALARLPAATTSPRRASAAATRPGSSRRQPRAHPESSPSSPTRTTMSRL